MLNILHKSARSVFTNNPRRSELASGSPLPGEPVASGPTVVPRHGDQCSNDLLHTSPQFSSTAFSMKTARDEKPLEVMLFGHLSDFAYL